MKRILIFVLLIALVFVSVSCESNKNKQRNTVLTVNEDCVYSDGSKAAFSIRILEIFEKVFKGSHIVFNEETKNSILRYCNDTFFDVLSTIPIYESELDELIKAADEALSLSNKPFDIESLSSLYIKTLSVLDNERNGAFSFESLKFFLTFRAETDKKSDELLKTLTEELGKKAFSEILNIFIFFGSISAGLLPSELSGSSVVNDAEILLIFKCQAKYYSKLDLTGKDWARAVNLLCGLLKRPEGSSENIFTNIMYSLSVNGFFEETASAIPSFLSLYEAAINSLTQEDIAMIRSGRSNKLQIFCRAISNAENEFIGFTQELFSIDHTDSQLCYEEIKAIGYEQKYLDFIDNMSYSNPPELFDAIKSYGSTATIATYGDLNKSFLLYVYDLSPALAFALEHRLAEGFN